MRRLLLSVSLALFALAGCQQPCPDCHDHYPRRGECRCDGRCCRSHRDGTGDVVPTQGATKAAVEPDCVGKLAEAEFKRTGRLLFVH